MSDSELLYKQICKKIRHPDFRNDIFLYAIENDLTFEQLNFKELYKKFYYPQYDDYKTKSFSELQEHLSIDLSLDTSFIDNVLLPSDNNVDKAIENEFDHNLQKIIDKKEIYDFENAKLACKLMGIKSGKEYKKLYKLNKLPSGLPSLPEEFYKKYGWTNWADFLQSKYIKSNADKYLKDYREFERWVGNNLLPIGINSYKGWIKFKKNELTVKIPDFISRNPHQFYKHKGWVSWDYLFLTKNKRFKRIETYLNYEDAKKWVQENLVPCGINNAKQWEQYRNGKIKIEIELPANIPSAPNLVYKSRWEWKNWGDWFGTNNIASYNKVFCSYEDAKKWVKENFRGFNIHTILDWDKYLKNKIINAPDLPPNIPRYPNHYYKNNGWTGHWGDFLGRKRKNLVGYYIKKRNDIGIRFRVKLKKQKFYVMVTEKDKDEIYTGIIITHDITLKRPLKNGQIINFTKDNIIFTPGIKRTYKNIAV